MLLLIVVLLEGLAWSVSVTMFKLKKGGRNFISTKGKSRITRNISKFLTKGEKKVIFEGRHGQIFHNVAVGIYVFAEGALRPAEIPRLKRKDTHHIWNGVFLFGWGGYGESKLTPEVSQLCR